ncbi:hypothetical protein PC112_g7225 [Phytophthora cactorum]|nr:hypothetical protein PC112_g7225 [Phytophthora cactorum]
MKEAGAGSKCYVPDDTYVWLPAQILREDKSSDPKKPEKTVVLRVFPPPGDASAVVNEERVLDFNDPKVKAMLKSVQLESLPYQNENLGPDGIEDMTALNYLHEAAILYNVKKRFLQKLPYTYTGDICIAVNPYQWLPELYSEQTQSQYLTKARDELLPHVYATSMASYNDMKRHEMNQSILLLAASESKEKWFLDDANECYAYTAANKTIKIEGMSDNKHFERTKTALGLIGVSEELQGVLFEVLAGVLHLGQVEVQSKNNNEESEIVPSGQGAKNATKLLGISEADLEKALCSRQIAVAGDKVTTFLKKDQAEECIEDLVDKFWVFDVEHRNTDVPVKQRCEALMKKMQLSSPEQYQIGLSRIYFRYGILEQMEDKKAERLDLQARHLQHYMRGFCCRLLFLRKLQAIVKLQSVARCVIMMNRYQSFKTAVITLQAHWRGYKGRCIALEAKKNKSAIIIQKYARRFVKRKQFKDERKGAVKIQAFLRMKYERPKYIKALQEKKQQADMKYQLSKLQERLHDEQRRNAELKKDRLSTSSTDSQLYAESNGTRSRGRSIAHMWMADADGIISQLNEEANRLRKENEEQRALTAQLKSEVEKLKFDQTVLTANFQVKIRGFQDTIREKDKKLEAVERECVKLRELVGSDPVLSSQRSMRKDRRSVFRRLGSKKEFDDGYDNGDASRASTAMQAALAQRSAETAQFLRQSARRMSRAKMWRNNSGGDSDGEGRFSGSDMGDSGGRPSLLQEVSAAGAGAMESLKNRLTAVKEKYYGEEGPSAASRQNTELRRASAARESFNLDALPLPPGWETRLSRSKGKAYYCNPTLRITQWDHPSIESSKAKKQAAVSAQRAKRGISTAGSTVGSPPRDSIDGVLTMEGHI